MKVCFAHCVNRMTVAKAQNLWGKQIKIQFKKENAH